MPQSSFTDLGRRERQIMDVLARRGRASAADVHGDLEDPPSYSTVRSMLRVLEDKGYVRHEWEGPRHMYVPSAPAGDLKRSALKHLVQTFFGNSTEAAVVAMLGANDSRLSNEELDRLAKVIDDARSTAKAGQKSAPKTGPGGKP
ncbi:MAG: BlaI/MecI/CopY family transcriptional regulator [Phycisphaerae bacterium]|nr:BlaI/MecI/CopY family transcriptional regulator [Gemmatimonadaceae bacterium]